MRAFIGLLLVAMLAAAAPKPAVIWFAADKLHAVEIQVSAENWEKMQPKTGPMGGPPRPPRDDEDKSRPPQDNPPQPGPPRGPGPGGPGGFGFDFTYVPGSLTIDGETAKNIGIRFKGNSSYMSSARGLKRPFHLDFNRFDDKLTFHGLKALTLSNDAMDESHLRETLAYDCFRAAGVPCSRTALAAVTLHVPDKYDHRALGLYTIVEPVDKVFLEHAFGTKNGLLLKPERLNDLEYMGDAWSKYSAKYGLKSEPTPTEKAKLIALLRLIHRADDVEFAEKIGTLLDVDEFLRFVAAEALLANMDSFLAVGHNFYLFFHPKTERFVFMPWDNNHAFGGFPMAGNAKQQTELSVAHPWAGNNTLIKRVFAIAEHKATYDKHVRKLIADFFNEDALTKQVERYETLIKDAAAKERKDGNFLGRPPRMPDGVGPLPLREFIALRCKSITAQLAGESKGYIPERVGPPPGMQPGGQPGNQPRDRPKEKE